MKTQVEFCSGKFPPYDGEEDKINPGLYGKRLAEYLVANLRSAGIETDEIFSEDWGWVIPVKSDKFFVWIGCGSYAEYPNGFLCFVEASQPFIQRLFNKLDTTEEVQQITDALNKILTSDPEIRDVQWY